MTQLGKQSPRQHRFPETPDDTKTVGSALETGVDMQDWADNVASAFRQAKGTDNWYDQVPSGGSIKDLAEKKFANRTAQLFDFTVSGGPLGGLVIPSTLVSGNIAVGPGSTSDGGVIAAEESNFSVAGTFAAGQSIAADGNGVILNKVKIVSASNNEIPEDGSGREIVGLIQCLQGTLDDAAIAGNPSENLQISFVAFDGGTDAYVAATLPDGNYQFTGLFLNKSFKDLTKGFGIDGGTDASILGNVESIKPNRAFITTGAIAVDDALNVSSGAFAASADCTVETTQGSVVLPSNGADFKTDSRIQIYLNGQYLIKGSGSGNKNDVYWVSATQIAFPRALVNGETIVIVTPEAI